VPARTFVVTVSDTPHRVVVEDVRSRRRAVSEDLADVGRQIADLLEGRPQGADRGADGQGSGVSES
jgi:hypothetical protein